MGQRRTDLPRLQRILADVVSPTQKATLLSPAFARKGQGEEKGKAREDEGRAEEGHGEADQAEEALAAKEGGAEGGVGGYLGWSGREEAVFEFGEW